MLIFVAHFSKKPFIPLKMSHSYSLIRPCTYEYERLSCLYCFCCKWFFENELRLKVVRNCWVVKIFCPAVKPNHWLYDIRALGPMVPSVQSGSGLILGK